MCAQNDVFEQLMCLGLELVKQRMRTLGWYLTGYPGSFAGLLDNEKGNDFALRMRSDFVVWQEWQEQAKNNTLSGRRLQPGAR